MINTKRRIIGSATARRIFQPASDKPKTAAGRRKKANTKYAMANQRYVAVLLPRVFATLIGTFRR